MAIEEYWGNNQHDNEYPILRNYLYFTYDKLVKEEKILYSKNNDYSCFNTGLTDRYYEPIFAFFKKNERKAKPEHPEWFFLRFAQKTDKKFSEAFGSHYPERANYFKDPSKLIYNPNYDLNVNYSHIIDTNLTRFPTSFTQNKTTDEISTYLSGEIQRVQKRIVSNYKIAIPQYHKGEINLLLPLCFTPRTPNADLALVITEDNCVYTGRTCLTLDMAYNNARLIVKPESDWLKPR